MEEDYALKLLNFILSMPVGMDFRGPERVSAAILSRLLFSAVRSRSHGEKKENYFYFSSSFLPFFLFLFFCLPLIIQHC